MHEGKLEMDYYVQIVPDRIFLIISNTTFKRGRWRAISGAKIRRPKEIWINKQFYIFTRNEWKRARKRALESMHFQREEIEDKIKMCKRLAAQRSFRLKLEADAIGIQMGSNGKR
jgi:hypothetical protein